MPRLFRKIIFLLCAIFILPELAFAGPDKDPFRSSNKKRSVSHTRGLSGKRRSKLAKSKRKSFSLSGRQRSHQKDYSSRMRARGVRGGYNLTADHFSYKRKKKFKSTGSRGESRYKKKSRKVFKLFGHGGRETRRMDKASKKSFKKK